MSTDPDAVSILRASWANTSATVADSDYELIADLGAAFAARSRAGLAALVVPLSKMDASAVGRLASGLELLGYVATRFVHGGRDWTGPAAALVCSDPDLLEAFGVLAADVVARSAEGGATWSTIVAVVEEWQMLLASRGRPSNEAETGLWGELWFINASANVGRTLATWRGPERDAADFFVDGMSAEIKTARARRQHHVSMSQVEAPIGVGEAWLVSIWVKVDPAATVTVPVLVDEILERAPDRADALRRIARAGYSPADRKTYCMTFAVLAEPEWYRVDRVPRVRAVDIGVSQLRYRISLDASTCADSAAAQRLWRHFHGHDYRSTER
ncbi:MAG: PD-(D/E)XK motif protein [Deltaproteobacteria bacterium]|nr:PD-(D/E)XK motif protein [Deltaproteobacteria bacterium]